MGSGISTETHSKCFNVLGENRCFYYQKTCETSWTGNQTCDTKKMDDGYTEVTEYEPSCFQLSDREDEICSEDLATAYDQL